MQILVIGCGKVGRALVAQLSQEEGNNISVVDTDPDVIRTVALQYDVMGIVGNGTSYSVLQEAGVERANILIAVTESDEVNLLCCVIARKRANCHTIARVRNPIYSKERELLKEGLEVSMIINPEYAAAREIWRLLRFPRAVEIDSFAAGRADMLRFKVPAGSMLAGMDLREFGGKIPENILVCVAEREGKAIIPDGDFRICEGDALYVFGTAQDADSFFDRIGIRTNRVKDTMIVGGGGVGYYLTEMLQKTGIGVKLVEQDRARCEELSEFFPDATVICGDGSKQELLAEEHLEQMDSMVACTGIDEENIILSLYAKKKVKTKVVTKINHVEFDDVLESLDLDSTINPKLIAAAHILQYVRATGKTMDSNVEQLYKLLGGRVEALEFKIRAESAITGTKLQDLQFKSDILIAGIVRDGQLLIPGGQDEICVDDSVIVVTTHMGFVDILDLLEK